MTNKASNQHDDIWGVITKGLVKAVKRVNGQIALLFLP